MERCHFLWHRIGECEDTMLVLDPTKDGIIVKTLFHHDEIVAMPSSVPKMKLDENDLLWQRC
ncbi:MAG: hypothetical protein Q4E91_10890 [Lachnospiraceae bacterium]|nr:hypothetical protein [Lachnospiraceae bacterium]